MSTLTPEGYPFRQVKSWIRRESKLTSFEENFLQGNSSYIQSLSALIERWQTASNKGQKIFIDIGCGDGQSTLQLAQWDPMACVTGIETHTPGIIKGLFAAHKAHTENLAIFHGDFLDILDAAPNVLFDRVHLYFSDPWQKSRHHKRRLIQTSFLQALRKHLTESSILHIATDWENYAQHIAEILAECAWLTASSQHPESAGLEFIRSPTKYERRGMAKGHSIFEFYIQLKRDVQL